MNESYFDNLSDVDLRQELRNYGFPVLPVTETTRNLLIKKLKHHVFSNATISNKPNRRSFQPSASPGRRNVSPGRRRSHSFSRSGNILNKSETETPDLKSEKISSLADQKAFYLSKEGVSYLQKDRDHGKCFVGKSVDGNINSPQNKIHNSNYPTKRSSPKIFLPPPILVNDVHYSSKRVESPRIPREIDRTPLQCGRESSGVVSRLLKLRDISIRGTLSSTTSLTTKNNLYLSDSDSDSSSPTRYSMLKSRCNRSIPDIIWNRLNIKGKFKQSSVPYLLIGCLGLFFVVLAILYMTKPPDMPSTMLEKSTSFTLCEELTQIASLARPSINCINNDLIAASLTLCKELIQLLQVNTEIHYCKDRETSAEVYGTEFIKYLYMKHSSDGHKLVKSFHAALYLIERNPQWKIEIINKSESQLTDIYRQDVRFILLKPYLPWKCILLNKMQRFFFIIGTIFLIALALTVAFVIWRFVNQRSLLKIKVVENFCKDINKELMHMSSLKNDTGGGEIIINHLRDKLVPLSKRKSLLWAWNEAIQKLEAGDSRIQFGTILQNGEEFRTMKWVECTPSPSSSPAISHHEKYDGRPQKKHWQSPAFDNVNKILDPPTNCLKIRHMFDTAEANHPDLKQSVIESILEKVGAQCRIYDIQLDRQNCCVYIRCASERDAGIIHNEVNGWWFDNRLVSIKFLRLQRFLTRFPNSTSATTLTIKNSK